LMAGSTQLGIAVPIGQQISNTQVYILNQSLKPVTIGVAGELYVGGDGLARGYLHNPILTSEKFIRNPLNSSSSEYLYKTGDLAKYLADGNIDFLCRIDSQVKIRGFRIELTEIESILIQHPDIREVVVIAREDQIGNKQLVAYVVPENPVSDNNSISTTTLRASLREKVPDYMIPAAFVILDAIPLNPNGKLDRKNLPAPTVDIFRGEQAFIAPINPMETLIANVWSQVLVLERVGVNDNFFDIGGNSLLVIQVHNRLQQMLNRDISIVDLFRYTTIKALAEYLTIDRDNHDRNQKLPDPSREQLINRTDRQKQALKRQQQLSNQRRQGNV